MQTLKSSSFLQVRLFMCSKVSPIWAWNCLGQCGLEVFALAETFLSFSFLSSLHCSAAAVLEVSQVTEPLGSEYQSVQTCAYISHA